VEEARDALAVREDHALRRRSVHLAVEGGPLDEEGAIVELEARADERRASASSARLATRPRRRSSTPRDRPAWGRRRRVQQRRVSDTSEDPSGSRRAPRVGDALEHEPDHLLLPCSPREDADMAIVARRAMSGRSDTAMDDG